MKSRSLEVMVGLFVIAGFCSLMVLALRISGLSVAAAQSGYRVYASFEDLGGLTVRSKVSLAGVTIGKVTDVTLDKEAYEAIVEMEIMDRYNNLTTDSIASIRTEGLLGQKYVDVSVGGDDEYLGEGDFFYSTQSALVLEKIIGRLVTDKLN